MKAFLVAFCGFAIAASAIAQPSADATTSGSAAAETRRSNAGTSSDDANARADDGERRICRRIEASTDRLGTQRICRTARQWRNARSD